MSKTLIVQGGGFRTGFAAGVLDAFMALDYYPFERIIGVSGGAIASSYYLAKQYGACVEAMYWLANDPEFVKLKHVIQERGYMKGKGGSRGRRCEGGALAQVGVSDAAARARDRAGARREGASCLQLQNEGGSVQ